MRPRSEHPEKEEAAAVSSASTPLTAADHNPQHLIEAAKLGDKHAFEALYKLYFKPVYRYIWLRVKEKAEVESLSQEVFLKIYRTLDSYESRGTSPLPYFFTIARTTIIDYWRKNRHQVSYGKEDMMIQIPDLSDGPQEKAEQRETRELLFQALNLLSADQRETVVQRYLNDVPNRDIARTMGKSEEAVRQLQSRGVRALREHMVLLVEAAHERAKKARKA